MPAAGANAATPAKIAVCHAPPSKPQYIRLIQVGSKGGALQDHTSHGGWLVTRAKCDAITDNDCDGAPNQAADDEECAATLGTGATCMAGMCEPPDGNTPVGTITESIFRGGIPPGSDSEFLTRPQLRPANIGLESTAVPKL